MFLVMVRYIIPALLITATFTSAKIFFVIIIGGVLAVLFILTLKEAAKKRVGGDCRMMMRWIPGIATHHFTYCG
jgi:hypothetical protein